MAKKKQQSSNTTNWSGITRFSAFWAVVIAGLVFVGEAIIRLINLIPNVNLSVNFGIFHTVASLLLTLALIIPGWRYSVTKPKFIQALYWVFIIMIFIFNILALTTL